MSGGLPAGAGKRNHALVHFDAHHYPVVFDQLGEGLPVIRLLVERLVKEDDAAYAGVDLSVGCKEQLAVKPPVLLCVLSINALEALGNAAWRKEGHTVMPREHMHSYGEKLPAPLPVDSSAARMPFPGATIL